ncbi:MAG: heavy-metal-associated domain-containing protein [Thermaceae bacterium]|nr:heavy-metal-associated domain-containing protein [Thermaceae bacterium]
MENTRQYRLKVPGMHCAGCIRTVEAALKRVPGTVRAGVDYLRKEATVAGEAPLQAWLDELQAVGYPAQAIPKGAR